MITTTAWERWVDLFTSVTQLDNTTVCYANAESGIFEVKDLLHNVGFDDIHTSQMETAITSRDFDVDGLVVYTLVEDSGWSHDAAFLESFRLKQDFPRMFL